MQQGRVQVDADWNELAELVYRRLRAETVDIMGRCAVPRQTPDGFLIAPGPAARTRSGSAARTSTGCSPRTAATGR